MENQEIIVKYIDHVLEHGGMPKSAHAFAKDLGISDREFFEKFPSFETLEAAIWAGLVLETVEQIKAGPEWPNFSAHQRLLTFHFAFCERILDERSFFLARFPRTSRGEFPGKRLEHMRKAFTDFAEKLIQEGKERDEVACRGPISKTYPQACFAHFVSVIEFNLVDESPGFERTDAFIEKSVKLAFDLIRTSAVDSAFDLVKFLVERRRGKRDDE